MAKTSELKGADKKIIQQNDRLQMAYDKYCYQWQEIDSKTNPMIKDTKGLAHLKKAFNKKWVKSTEMEKIQGSGTVKILYPG